MEIPLGKDSFKIKVIHSYDLGHYLELPQEETLNSMPMDWLTFPAAKMSKQLSGKDKNAMANSIYADSRYPGLAKTLTQEGLNQIRGFSWKVQRNKIKGLYRTLDLLETGSLQKVALPIPTL